MSEKSIEKIMQSAYAPELPYGFAERVARAAMDEPEAAAFWDFLLALAPKTGLAFSAVAMLLAVIGFAGSGPGLLESIDQYSALSSFLPLP